MPLTALVIGGGGNVWDEIKAARALFEPDAFLIINDMVPLWTERADYICTLHPEKMANWMGARSKNGYNCDAEIWAHKMLGPRNHAYQGIQRSTDDWAGSSGLFATKVALCEGFTKVVLAGVPLEKTDNHVVRQKPWTAAEAFKNGWKTKQKHLQPYVRSMSGWTRNFLGEPTPEWLREEIPVSGWSSALRDRLILEARKAGRITTEIGR